MTDLERIKKAVRELPADELSSFRRWFEEIDAKAWDGQIEQDALSDKLDKLADKALENYQAGKCNEL